MARKTPPFARISLDYAGHPKIAGLSDAAFRAHVELILYARRYLTDGLIPTRVITQLGSDVVTELVSNDEEHPSLSKDDDGNYWLYGFDYWQESKEEVGARAQVSRVNGRKGGRPVTRRETQTETQPGSDQGTQTEPASKAETETETETETTRAKALVGPRKRATRLPEDWQPSTDDVTWQRENHPAVDGKTETEKFRNHWHAKSGKDATKLDWSKTWRNWIIRAGEYGPRPVTAIRSGAYKPPANGQRGREGW